MRNGHVNHLFSNHSPYHFQVFVQSETFVLRFRDGTGSMPKHVFWALRRENNFEGFPNGSASKCYYIHFKLIMIAILLYLFTPPIGITLFGGF